MKTLLLALAFTCACSGDTTSGNDASTNDATSPTDSSTDAKSQTDATSPDGSTPTDSGAPDGPTFGDGGLGTGADCDPNNNLCQSTLLCCSEPTHNFDGGPLSSYKCEQPINGGCPLQP
jgi:hypothetical protein